MKRKTRPDPPPSPLDQLPPHLEAFKKWLRESNGESAPVILDCDEVFELSRSLVPKYKLTQELLDLEMECMFTQLYKPEPPPRGPKPFYYEIEDLPITPVQAARVITDCLVQLAKDYPSSSVLANTMTRLEAILLGTDEELKKIVGVIVLEHCDLTDPNSPLRSRFTPWWKNPTLARFLTEANIKKW